MKKILIVEDDYYIGDLYQRALVSAGYNIDLAVDGEEALQKVADSLYDLILLDIMLPKITGVDVLRSLRQKDSKTYDTPIFMITNLGQDNIIKEVLKIGADGYFIKSQVKVDDLIAEIGKIFENQKDVKS